MTCVRYHTTWYCVDRPKPCQRVGLLLYFIRSSEREPLEDKPIVLVAGSGAPLLNSRLCCSSSAMFLLRRPSLMGGGGGGRWLMQIDTYLVITWLGGYTSQYP